VTAETSEFRAPHLCYPPAEHRQILARTRVEQLVFREPLQAVVRDRRPVDVGYVDQLGQIQLP